MTAYVCDRCGVHFMRDNTPLKARLVRSIERVTFRVIVEKHEYLEEDMDLCPECHKELEMFLASKTRPIMKG